MNHRSFFGWSSLYYCFFSSYFRQQCYFCAFSCPSVVSCRFFLLHFYCNDYFAHCFFVWLFIFSSSRFDSVGEYKIQPAVYLNTWFYYYHALAGFQRYHVTICMREHSKQSKNNEYNLKFSFAEIIFTFFNFYYFSVYCYQLPTYVHSFLYVFGIRMTQSIS